MSNEPLQIGLPPRNGKCAVDFEASQTVQDDALSLREILVRFGAGQPIPSVQNSEDGYPFGDMDDTDFAFGDIQDFTDADYFASHAQNRINSIVEEAKKVRQVSPKTDESVITSPTSPSSTDDNINSSKSKKNE